MTSDVQYTNQHVYNDLVNLAKPTPPMPWWYCLITGLTVIPLVIVLNYIILPRFTLSILSDILIGVLVTLVSLVFWSFAYWQWRREHRVFLRILYEGRR